MDNLDLVQITKDQTGREAVMLRADKTLRQLMEEKPSSRWDPEYWHPKYEEILAILMNSNFKTSTLNDLMLDGIKGITYGQVGKRIYDKNGTVQYLQVSNIQKTGVDTFSSFALIKGNSYNDPPRSRLKELDLLLINGGVGSIGRSCVLVNKEKEYNISQDVDRIRFTNPIFGFYVAVFLSSLFGRLQIERYTKGVSGQTKFGFEHVRSITIPILTTDILKNIEKKYREMSTHHHKAIEAKKKDDKKEYKTNLEIAESILKDLITNTEAVIKGERSDVI